MREKRKTKISPTKKLLIGMVFLIFIGALILKHPMSNIER